MAKFTAGLLLLSLSSLFACSSIAQGVVEKPTVTVSSLGVSEISLSGVELDIALKIENPNTFDFAVNGVDYILSVNDEPFIKGAHRETTQIKAQATGEVSIPIKIKFGDVQKLIAAMDKLSTIGYKLNTVTHLDVPVFGEIEVPGEHDGSFKLSDFLRIQL